MYSTILLAAALQDWDRYSAHALAARDIAAVLAKSTTQHLHVLSVYDYDFKVPTSGLALEMVAQLREDAWNRTNILMERKIDDYIEPLKRVTGVEVTKILRVGNPRNVVVEVVADLKADLLVIGSHSKRSLFDISLGGTARHLSQQVSCTVVLVSPKGEVEMP
jgi:nucleotide-binding universal stress UspA family protein